MLDYSISFVILHYNVLNETYKCIDSIKKRMDTTHYSIVVVDNKSPNDTGKDLCNKYKTDPQVTVILNEKNLGFAKGNNIGIEYAKKVLKSDFLVVLNNDTYLIQDDFSSIIFKEWEKSYFAVLGPLIETPNDENQNPVAHEINTVKQVNFWIRHHQWGIFRTCLGINNLYLSIKDLIKRKIGYKNKTVALRDEKSNNRQENVKLHGCCFVFSPIFFENFAGFDPRTFMYLEEDILLTSIRQKGLLTVYNPSLKIFHSTKVATKSYTKKSRRTELFGYREGIKSLKILKGLLSQPQ